MNLMCTTLAVPSLFVVIYTGSSTILLSCLTSEASHLIPTTYSWEIMLIEATIPSRLSLCSSALKSATPTGFAYLEETTRADRSLRFMGSTTNV